MKARQVPAHLNMNTRVFRALMKVTHPDRWKLFRDYEIRLDDTIEDDLFEIVDAHTIKPFRYMRLGSQYWWKGTLYVNPLDERLLP